MQKLYELLNKGNCKYFDLDNEGHYIGCFFPIYVIFPDLPKFKLPDNKSKYNSKALKELQRYFKKINFEEITKGDLILFKIPKNILHIAIYDEYDYVIHLYKDDYLERIKLSLFDYKIIAVMRHKDGN